MLYLSLGSNIGNRLSHLQQASIQLKQVVLSHRFQCSPVYETPPWGNTEQQPFFNMVVGGSTNLTPESILQKVLAIEQTLGRFRTEKWAPRIIDIDVILIDNQIIKSPHLQVPHPLMHQRLFLLRPLADLAPDLVHPELGMSVLSLIDSCHQEPFTQVLSAKEFEMQTLLG